MLHSKLSIIEVLQIKGGLHGNKVKNIHTKHYQLCVLVYLVTCCMTVILHKTPVEECPKVVI